MLLQPQPTLQLRSLLFSWKATTVPKPTANSIYLHLALDKAFELEFAAFAPQANSRQASTDSASSCHPQSPLLSAYIVVSCNQISL